MWGRAGPPAPGQYPFHQWLRSFRAIHPCRNAVIIGCFEMVTADPAGSIRYVKRGEAFSDALPQEEAVFRGMDESFSERVGARRHNANGPRPKRGASPTRDWPTCCRACARARGPGASRYTLFQGPVAGWPGPWRQSHAASVHQACARPWVNADAGGGAARPCDQSGAAGATVCTHSALARMGWSRLLSDARSGALPVH